MFRIGLHRNILNIFKIFNRMCFWNRQENETIKERMLKWFYSILLFLYSVSLLAEAAVNDNMDEKIFSTQVALMIAVLWLKLSYILWRKRETLELLNEICDYYVDDRDAFIAINDKSNILMKFATYLFNTCLFCANLTTLVAPLIGTERKLFFQVWLPVNWRNDEYAFWMAYLYVFTEINIAVIATLFSAIMWYLMAHCGWRYGVFGRQIKKMGEVCERAEGPRISNSEKDAIYCRDLVRAMTSHSRFKELTDRLDSFLSDAFVVQLMTSGLCICGSIYCIAFMRGESSVDTYFKLIIYSTGLIFNIFDIFMIMFFGNQIMLGSERLAYCLYESNWVDRSQSIKKDILIFGEFLRQPHQLMILKIYPLTLETFSRILNSAYSMFNILKNFK